ncbi:MAG TPA: DmsC/YnfH family molybdoenzyme membrane anchor subunit [Stellaceae bacterium]|nr:DmsC/YnfH family molybdoenzyme membrane anchor subunit [Stellaceae bacterium]
MHPGLSIILFTTASGAGFALILLLGVGAPLGLLPQSSWFGLTALLIAVALAAGGLVSSTYHLGRPERAWRAFSQWRSSWLSREGVFAVLTFVPTAIFGIGWVFFGTTGGAVGLCGLIAAGLAVATVVSTGMIYASLKPIRQWHNFWTVPNYLLLGLMSGWLILDLLVRFWGGPAAGTAFWTFVVVIVAWWVKEVTWRFIDTTSALSTVESATALGRSGRVRLFEAPHTEENYLLQEMGFRVARKHARRLRMIARFAAFIVPVALTLFALAAGGVAGAIAAGVAVASAALGLVVERWLFFAEARHTVTLYYGAQAV